MKKILAIVMMLMMFSALASAKIVVETNNMDGTVRYRSYKHITRMASVDEYAILKIVAPNDPGKYYFKLRSYGASDVLYANTAIMKIDGNNYTLNRYVAPQVPNWPFNREYIEVVYIIPNDVMAQIANSKALSFKVTKLNNNKETEFEINDANYAEAKRMLNLTFNDFNKDKVVNP